MVKNFRNTPETSKSCSDMIPDPFKYPFRGDRTIDTFLIGGGLHLASVFVPVLPLVFALGYLVRTLSECAHRNHSDRFETLPQFENVIALGKNGIGSGIVVLSFLLPATVTLLGTIVGVPNKSLSASSISFGTSLGFVLGSSASLLLAMTFVYLLPAALTNYVANDDLRAAFEASFLWRAATHAGYFYNVVAGIIVGMMFLWLASLLVSIAVGFFVAFYGEVVTIAFWARGVGQILPETA